MSEITNNDDLIDSRNVEERISELLPYKVERIIGYRLDLETGETDGNPREEFATEQEGLDWIAEQPDEDLAVVEYIDEREELESLKRLKAAADSEEEWPNGITFIRDSHFEDYAKDYAEDILGNVVRNAAWPFSHVDWEAAAEDLQQDYASLEWDGVEYWYR